MLKLRMKKGVWVDYPDAVGVRFKIRPLSFYESLKILSLVKEKKVITDPENKVQIIDDYDNAQFLWESFNKTLESWEGIQVEIDEGERQPADEEIRRALFDNDGVREFVFNNARELAEIEAKEREADRKN